MGGVCVSMSVSKTHSQQAMLSNNIEDGNI